MIFELICYQILNFFDVILDFYFLIAWQVDKWNLNIFFFIFEVRYLSYLRFLSNGVDRLVFFVAETVAEWCFPNPTFTQKQQIKVCLC